MVTTSGIEIVVNCNYALEIKTISNTNNGRKSFMQ